MVVSSKENGGKLEYHTLSVKSHCLKLQGTSLILQEWTVPKSLMCLGPLGSFVYTSSITYLARREGYSLSARAGTA